MLRPLSRSLFFLALFSLAFVPVLADDSAGSAERRLALFDEAWGPESPEVLEKYLAVRQALQPRMTEYAGNVTQYALREASTHSALAPILMSVTLVRKKLEDALQAQGLEFDDYQRLTILVYGRWLRATSDSEPPEARVVRTLQEIEIGLSRQIAHGNFASEEERKEAETRHASVLHQARFLAPYAFMDKEAVLAGLDAGTVAWLESHRADFEEVDYGIFDTMAPQREGAVD